MIKAVVFDLDGTLLDRDESVKAFIAHQYERYFQSLKHIPKETYIKRFITLDQRGYVWKDNVYQQLVHEFGITELTWKQLLQDYIANFYKSCIPFPNLIPMLETLRDNGIVLGMITNGKGQFQWDNIKALGIESYFSTILISEWEGLRKPQPEIFRRAIDRLGVKPPASMFVGDHPENDVRAAQAVGMIGSWKRDDYWKCGHADFIVEDLLDIPIMVKKYNKTKND